MEELNIKTIASLSGLSEYKVTTLLKDGIIKPNETSMRKHLEEVKKITDNHYTPEETFQLLGYPKGSDKRTLFNLEKRGYLKIKRIDYPINQVTIWTDKKSVEFFVHKLHTDFILMDLAYEKYDLKRGVTERILEQYKIETIKYRKYLYINIKGLTDALELENQYYSLTEASEVLNFSRTSLEKICKSDDVIEGVIINKGIYQLPKTEVHRVKKEINKLRKDYYTFRDLREKYNIEQSNQLSKRFVSIERPPIANAFDAVKGGSKFLYLKTSVDDYYKRTIKHSNNAILNAPLDAVDYFLWLFDEIDFSTKQKETKELLRLYCIQYISSSQASNITLRSYASELHEVGKHISTHSPKETFSLTSIEINQLIQSEKRKTIQKRIYAFTTYCLTKRMCRYTLKETKNPHVPHVSINEKEVYSFEEFTQIYEHARKMELHTLEALKKPSYASVWLYVLVHVTNAWRQSDVLRMPPVFPEEVGIQSMDWFENNELSLPQAQRIINQVGTYDLQITKTGMKRHFFCHSQLVIPMATAMLICEFHRRIQGDKSLISFKEGHHSTTQLTLGMFFSKDPTLSKSSFRFGSLKMNRSLMEHLFYSIQKQQGKGNSAFEMVQKMRNHKSEVTKDYIRITNESEMISSELFNRGEFGYIYDALIDVLTEEKETLTMRERTKRIQQLSEHFEPMVVEASMGFLDVMEAEKNSITTQVLKLQPSEALNYIRKIYLEQMPSKLEHVQCFTYPSCHKPSCDFSCLQCPFSIPTIYSLTALMSDIESRVDALQRSTIPGVRKKEMKMLTKGLDVLSQALVEYGEETVWSFMQGGESALEEKLSLLE